MQYALVSDYSRENPFTYIDHGHPNDPKTMQFPTDLQSVLLRPGGAERIYGHANRFLRTISREESVNLAGIFSLMRAEVDTSTVVELDEATCPKITRFLQDQLEGEMQLSRRMQQFLRDTYPEHNAEPPALSNKAREYGIVSGDREMLLKFFELTVLTKIITPILGTVIHRYKQLGEKRHVVHTAKLFPDLYKKDPQYQSLLEQLRYHCAFAHDHYIEHFCLRLAPALRDQTLDLALSWLLVGGLAFMNFQHIGFDQLYGHIYGYVIRTILREYRLPHQNSVPFPPLF